MSKRKLPALALINFRAGENGIDKDVLARWEQANVKAEDGDNVINIFDVIGEDYYGQGFSAKKMADELKRIGSDKDVVVAINSPGGSFFEGAAIYNLLVGHTGKVTIKILGLAASAASVIAMAGDEILISQVGFIMIHNAWAMVIGNRNDLRDAADTFETFDMSMRDLYAARTGNEKKAIEKMMDSDTWLNAEDAVEKGFSDGVINVKKTDDKGSEKKSKAMAMRTIEIALAQNGFSRKERDEIFQGIGLRDATAPAARDAGEEDNGWSELIKTLRT